VEVVASAPWILMVIHVAVWSVNMYESLSEQCVLMVILEGV